LISLTAMPYMVIMPVFAKEILGGGADTLGFLMTAVGAGALTGAIYLASRKSLIGLGRIISYSGVGFGAGLMLFALSGQLWLSLLILYFVGIGMMVQVASSNTILQTVVDDDKRGRVMSFYTMAFVGVAPFGSLLAGLLSEVVGLGAPLTVALGGILSILGALVFWRRLPALRKIIRPIYLKKGVIKPMELGLNTAAQLTKPPDA
jgi:MFS family permease